MRTLKLTIAYDGTDFAGWQRQAADRTVQATIEDALLPIEGSRAILIGAGRTDAGVHAAGQVASVTLAAPIATDDLRRALNATLPADVRILSIEEMSGTFNAQFAARRKTYHYAIWSNGVVPPALRRYVWHVAQPLDVAAMNAAAQVVVGSHDFSAYQAAGSDVVTSVRTIVESSVAVAPVESMTLMAGPHIDGNLLAYHIMGSGFLRHMVRNIIGTLVDIGRGRKTPDEMQRILESRNRALASATAPAKGLTLWRVDY